VSVAEAAEPEAELTLAESVEAPEKSTQSVMDVLRAGYDEAAQKRPERDVVIPGYGEPNSELHILYRSIDDYEDVRNETRKALAKKALSPAKREMELGKQTLLAASTSSYALIKGVRHEIGLPLGLELYAQMFPNRPGPGTDGEACILLFHGKTSVMMNQYANLDQWMRKGGLDDPEEMLGE
jgi:hypothetical protein